MQRHQSSSSSEGKENWKDLLKGMREQKSLFQLEMEEERETREKIAELKEERNFIKEILQEESKLSNDERVSELKDAHEVLQNIHTEIDLKNIKRSLGRIKGVLKILNT